MTDRFWIDDGEEVLEVEADAQGHERILGRRLAAEVGTTAGLIDLQVNGFAGVDFNDRGITAAALDAALEAMLACGVTTCLPTVITAPADELEARLTQLDAAMRGSRLGALIVPGYHLEGPFLNADPGYAGCHPASAMIDPSIALVQGLERNLARPILLVTIAPERAGGLDFVRWATRSGKLVAIGHAAPEPELLRLAVEAGAVLSTHLGNGLPHQLHKFRNPLFAQLAEDGLCASFIADGIHVPPGVLKVMIRAKSWRGSLLVTDAVAAAMAEPGLYPFAGMTVELQADGTVRQPGTGVLAGSSLTLDQAIRNLVDWGLGSWRQALALACARPRALLARLGVRLPVSEVRWSRDRRPACVRLGPIVREFG